jgi:hypothetical protein
MNSQDTRMGLTKLVTEQNMSSVTILSEYLGIDEDTARVYLQDLVETGELKGYITEDGSRFFKSDVRVTSAPIVSSHDDWNPETHDTKIGKIIFVTGIAFLATGQVLPRLFSSEDLNVGLGAALAMFGFVVILVGLANLGCKDSE